MGRFGWGLRDDGENNYIIINDLVVGGAVCCWLLSSNDCRLRTVATFFIVCAGLMSVVGWGGEDGGENVVGITI